MYDDYPGVDRVWKDRRIRTTAKAITLKLHAHQRHGASQPDMTVWGLERIHWRGDECVLDAGCGAGDTIDVLKRCAPQGLLVTGDISLDLLHDMRIALNMPRRRLVMDAQDLPFPDGAFDVAIANHMLHQVPDIHHTIKEMRRVLKPDGALMVAANSSYHALRLGGHRMRFDDLYRRAYGLLGVYNADSIEVRPNILRFNLENGIFMLARYFRAVARYDLPTTMIFPDRDSVMAYIDSTRTSHEPDLPPSVSWDMLMEVMTAQIEQIIGYFGKMTIDMVSGMFVASNAEGFTAPPQP